MAALSAKSSISMPTKEFTVEIADGVRIRLLTAALQQVYNPDELAYNARSSA